VESFHGLVPIYLGGRGNDFGTKVEKRDNLGGLPWNDAGAQGWGRGRCQQSGAPLGRKGVREMEEILFSVGSLEEKKTGQGKLVWDTSLLRRPGPSCAIRSVRCLFLVQYIRGPSPDWKVEKWVPGQRKGTF